MTGQQKPDIVSDAIQQLNNILPLKQMQDELDETLKQLHLDILQSYVINGRSLTRNEIAQRIVNDDYAINALKNSQMVVFNNDDEPVGAYPFTMEEREHKIHINNHLVHSMCALDSLAVSPMFHAAVTVDSICHITGTPVRIEQYNYTISNATDVKDLYFCINWNAASDNRCCANSLCTEMIFIKGRQTTDVWLENDPVNRQIFTLDEAIRFAAGFFVPLME